MNSARGRSCWSSTSAFEGFLLRLDEDGLHLPTWLQLAFGQTLVFDRRDEKEGSPVPGKKPEAVTRK